ncbi:MULTISPECIES: bifunctional DNA-formamidopyrimidine glycosylase/DNA-(apurinic or apyrimidinic site) lyase [unclassified Psychrobacter]|uniref:bifunctional DNA-formamidopyrimidine glycosylase/DNA-(apurinic or apyrimidinic site) lyase n=1 Tax=unclassified Psychrobacter TaxID=196806 RepID=UPI0025B4C188|nr:MULTISPECIES: bifunctional DNA-formamidopyrimidine glycosylase/DNA-(apurinic or apyrimidinic site) lyase [unclassified Psychrobacter]MDN3452301.1 bifunctional DNA-formamidopyrimidine glycosylase/DNA-(apurinic or apyrimidinic site) lyase [Psychrobacter sp. APC 3350]MDN3502777.1 bifunctional DNA-formamidopyrimidine glycosylase/DNA-(apurinic or apyrimidinic site) lyase [Psychrobacter sp. 5A.1]
MPELPEVETTKTSLAPLLGQQVIDVKIFQPKLRWMMPEDLDRLVDYTLDSVERRAKYLILNFLPLISNQTMTAVTNTVAPRQLLIHLGMSGSLQQHSFGTDKRKHDHLVMVFNHTDDTKSQLHYYDPRRFGSVLWHEDYGNKLLDHLGPEPLSEDFTADYLYGLIQRLDLAGTNSDRTLPDNTKTNKRQKPIARAIKSVIMEQEIVVGVGNIYATESLYLSAIHPATPAHQLTYDQIVVLVDHIKDILQKAIKLGGSTLRDFTVASGQTGYFQQTLNVYGRQGESCPHCNTTLENIKLNGRASVYCPRCQPIN